MVSGVVLILFIFGILSILYTGVLIAYAGISVSYLWIWPCMGLIFFLVGGSLWYMQVKQLVLLATKYKNIIFFLLLLVAIVIGSIEGMILHCENAKAVSDADYMIILGAQVKGSTVSRSLRYRLDTAVDYLKDNKQTKVIVSGGQGKGEDITEAEAMFVYLVNQGVESCRIIKEEHSTNTEENIRYSRQYITGAPKNIVIVSNGFHLYRALAIGKKQGLEIGSGLAAPTDAIMRPHYYLREALAILKYKITGNI